MPCACKSSVNSSNSIRNYTTAIYFIFNVLVYLCAIAYRIHEINGMSLAVLIYSDKEWLFEAYCTFWIALYCLNCWQNNGQRICACEHTCSFISLCTHKVACILIRTKIDAAMNVVFERNCHTGLGLFGDIALLTRTSPSSNAFNTYIQMVQCVTVKYKIYRLCVCMQKLWSVNVWWITKSIWRRKILLIASNFSFVLSCRVIFVTLSPQASV